MYKERIKGWWCLGTGFFCHILLFQIPTRKTDIRQKLNKFPGELQNLKRSAFLRYLLSVTKIWLLWIFLKNKQKGPWILNAFKEIHMNAFFFFFQFCPTDFIHVYSILYFLYRATFRVGIVPLNLVELLQALKQSTHWFYVLEANVFSCNRHHIMPLLNSESFCHPKAVHFLCTLLLSSLFITTLLP